MIYLSLFAIFLRVGLFSFGGGLAMLPLIFQSIQKFGIMTGDEFSDLVGISQVTPGPVAVNAATFVGFSSSGVLGAVAATLGVCIPSFLLMLLVLKFIEVYRDSRIIQGIFDGIRPVTIGLIAAAAVFVSGNVLVNGDVISTKLFTGGLDYYNLIPIAIFAVTILLTGFLKVGSVKVILIMGVAGAFLCR